jgi:ligand-binding SRPBCC domain-containing protein
MVTLNELTVIRAPIARCFDLARSVEVHLAGNVHWGEAAVAEGGITSGLVGRGQRVTWRAKHFAVWQRLTSEITAMDRPVYFQDTMIEGPFRFMQHNHTFRTLSSEMTEMGDVFRFAAPLPILGRLAEILVLRRYMQSLLRERIAALKTIAEYGTGRQLLFISLVHLVSANILGPQRFRGFVEVAGQQGHLLHVRHLRVLSEIPNPHVFGHALPKWCHERLLCDGFAAEQRLHPCAGEFQRKAIANGVQQVDGVYRVVLPNTA